MEIFTLPALDLLKDRQTITIEDLTVTRFLTYESINYCNWKCYNPGLEHSGTCYFQEIDQQMYLALSMIIGKLHIDLKNNKIYIYTLNNRQETQNVLVLAQNKQCELQYDAYDIKQYKHNFIIMLDQEEILTVQKVNTEDKLYDLHVKIYQDIITSRAEIIYDDNTDVASYESVSFNMHDKYELVIGSQSDLAKVYTTVHWTYKNIKAILMQNSYADTENNKEYYEFTWSDAQYKYIINLDLTTKNMNLVKENRKNNKLYYKTLKVSLVSQKYLSTLIDHLHNDF